MTKKIKILYITQCYGGVGTYIKHIIDRINREKFLLEIIGPYDEDFINYCKKSDISFHMVNMVRGINLIKDLKAYLAIKKIRKKIKPDIIHLHSSKAGILGRLAFHKKNANTIFTPHGISYMSFKGMKRILFMLCEIFTSKFTNKVLTCSYSEISRLHFEIGIPMEDMSVILNSIPIPKERCSKREFNKDSVIHLGSIMRLTTQKDPLVYIETAKLLANKYQNIHFSILGAGLTDDLKPQVLNKINEYNLNNQFEIIKWREQSKSIEYLDSLDLFILPSLFEGLPLSPIEAMSRDIPCILSKGDGCKDLLNNGENGFACITPQQYFLSIVQLIENSELRTKIRDNAFEYIQKNHNIEIFIEQIELYYLDLLTLPTQLVKG